METPNDINSRVKELENENRILKRKNKVFIDAIIILKKRSLFRCKLGLRIRRYLRRYRLLGSRSFREI